MLERIIDIALERRALVLLAAIAVGGLGIYNFQYLPIDAVPDITNIQVQINTEAPGYSPLEIELAEVRWSTGREFGLEFLRMASQERQRLLHILKSLEPGPP